VTARASLLYDLAAEIKQRTGRESGRAAAEREHQKRKPSAATFKNQPLLNFFYSPMLFL
jgi:hypothetical protein